MRGRSDGGRCRHHVDEGGTAAIRYPCVRAMANKRTRKQKERATVRRPAVPGGAATELLDAPTIDGTVVDDITPVEAASAPATAPAAAAVTAAPQGRRRVQRITASLPASPERRLQRGQPAGFIAPLESDDAAIPFDRVPYVPADLRRVAVIATLMVVLIIVADIIVSNVVT